MDSTIRLGWENEVGIKLTDKKEYTKQQELVKGKY